MVVEADETYFGNVEERMPSTHRRGRPYTKGGKSGPGGKRAVISLVERGGRVRSFHAAKADAQEVAEIVNDNIDRETRLHTDESKLYTRVGSKFAAHETVNHSAKEYARGDVTTNSVEGYFSIFKRGMRGVYQHCGEKHLHRYLAEYDFRYNHREKLGYNDADRATAAVKGAVNMLPCGLSTRCISMSRAVIITRYAIKSLFCMNVCRAVIISAVWRPRSMIRLNAASAGLSQCHESTNAWYCACVSSAGDL
jgi:hypothetical protein